MVRNDANMRMYEGQRGMEGRRQIEVLESDAYKKNMIMRTTKGRRVMNQIIMLLMRKL